MEKRAHIVVANLMCRVKPGVTVVTNNGDKYVRVNSSPDTRVLDGMWVCLRSGILIHASEIAPYVVEVNDPFEPHSDLPF